jgi:arsenite methyltransferase
MIDQIEARLEFLRLTARAKLEASGVALDQAAPLLAAARTALADGLLGYSMLIAQKDAHSVAVGSAGRQP